MIYALCGLVGIAVGAILRGILGKSKAPTYAIDYKIDPGRIYENLTIMVDQNLNLLIISQSKSGAETHEKDVGEFLVENNLMDPINWHIGDDKK